MKIEDKKKIFKINKLNNLIKFLPISVYLIIVLRLIKPICEKSNFIFVKIQISDIGL